MARMEKYRIQSAGATAYTLEVGFVPDTVEVWNYTKFETDGTKVKFYWHRDMTAGYALSEICDDTGTNRAIETSNGFTPLETVSIASNKATLNAFTQAVNGQGTTAAAHGFSVGDKIRLRDIGGMVELNDQLVKILTVPATTTFTIDLDTTGYTTFAAGSALNSVEDVSKVVTASGSYRVTLGTTIMGANDDILFVEARQADQYTNIGDVA